MAVKFQYNKTSLNTITKQLKMRVSALPTLKNKESALRLEVRKAKERSEKLLAELDAALQRYDYLASLWNEFDGGLISITGHSLGKSAGIWSMIFRMVVPRPLLPMRFLSNVSSLLTSGSRSPTGTCADRRATNSSRVSCWNSLVNSR